MSDLSFKVDKDCVRVAGKLNRDNVGAAWRARGDWVGSSGDLTLDCSDVQQVDSSGIAMFIQLIAELAESNRSLSLQNTNTQLRQFAEVSGVTELLSLSYAESKQ
ncbi:Putative NTP binding protein (contains STAS domain) [Idiomarina sp. A28L]|uniref:STAS domain-containing protein n=1 Tax=Idiomarina sp. A28L TaxID=1036674 RepID=UPI0002138828|nr:STAS domain-containing protein [Idiomarina sp. A28L]EGN74869.1 Putative NTP binding protein (contains STAS domain) [Idiomarina sp. A28L]